MAPQMGGTSVSAVVPAPSVGVSMAAAPGLSHDPK